MAKISNYYRQKANINTATDLGKPNTDFVDLAKLNTSLKNSVSIDKPKVEDKESPNFFQNLIGDIDEFVTRFATGVYKGIEGIADLGATALGAITGNEKFSNWAKKDISSNIAEWEKVFNPGTINFWQNATNSDYWKDLWKSYGNMFSGKLTAEDMQDYHDRYYNFNDTIDTKVGEFAGGLLSSFGEMLPSIAVGNFASGLGANANVAKNVGLGAFGLAAGGNSAEESLQEGDDAKTALAYGIGKGAVETVSELVVGKALNGIASKLGATELAKSFGNNLNGVSFTKELFAKKGIKEVGASMLEEGAEEVFADLFDPLVRKVSGKEEKPLDAKEIAMSFLSGAVMGGITSGSGAVRNSVIYGKDVVNNAKAISDYVSEYDKRVNENGEDAQTVADELGEKFGKATQDLVKSLDNMTERQQRAFAEDFLGVTDTTKTKEAMRLFKDSKTADIITQYARNEIANINEKTGKNLAIDFVSDDVLNDKSKLESYVGRALTNEEYNAFKGGTKNAFQVGNKVVIAESQKANVNRLIIHEAISHAILDNNKQVRNDFYMSLKGNKEFMDAWENLTPKVMKDYNISENMAEMFNKGQFETLTSETLANTLEAVLDIKSLREALNNTQKSKLSKALQKIKNVISKRNTDIIDKLTNTINELKSQQTNNNEQVAFSKGENENGEQNETKRYYSRTTNPYEFIQTGRETTIFDSLLLVYEKWKNSTRKPSSEKQIKLLSVLNGKFSLVEKDNAELYTDLINSVSGTTKSYSVADKEVNAVKEEYLTPELKRIKDNAKNYGCNILFTTSQIKNLDNSEYDVYGFTYNDTVVVRIFTDHPFIQTTRHEFMHYMLKHQEKFVGLDKIINSIVDNVITRNSYLDGNKAFNDLYYKDFLNAYDNYEENSVIRQYISDRLNWVEKFIDFKSVYDFAFDSLPKFISNDLTEKGKYAFAYSLLMQIEESICDAYTGSMLKDDASFKPIFNDYLNFDTKEFNKANGIKFSKATTLDEFDDLEIDEDFLLEDLNFESDEKQIRREQYEKLSDEEKRFVYFKNSYDRNYDKLVKKLNEKMSAQSKEYFKNSVIRSGKIIKVGLPNGLLIPMFHGTPNKNMYYFDSKRIGERGTQRGYGFYLVNSLSTAQSYADNGKVLLTFVNITKPLSDREMTLTKPQIKKFVKLYIDSNAEYGTLSDYGDVNMESYDSILNKFVDGIFDLADNDYELFNALYRNQNDLEFKLFAREFTNMFGFDGYVAWNRAEGTIAVAFQPEQIKSIDNMSPTTNKDIRFSKVKFDGETYTSDNQEDFIGSFSTLLQNYSDYEYEAIGTYETKLRKPYIKAMNQFAFETQSIYEDRYQDIESEDYKIENQEQFDKDYEQLNNLRDYIEEVISEIDGIDWDGNDPDYDDLQNAYDYFDELISNMEEAKERESVDEEAETIVEAENEVAGETEQEIPQSKPDELIYEYKNRTFDLVKARANLDSLSLINLKESKEIVNTIRDSILATLNDQNIRAIQMPTNEVSRALATEYNLNQGSKSYYDNLLNDLMYLANGRIIWKDKSQALEGVETLKDLLELNGENIYEMFSEQAKIFEKLANEKASPTQRAKFLTAIENLVDKVKTAKLRAVFTIKGDRVYKSLKNTLEDYQKATNKDLAFVETIKDVLSGGYRVSISGKGVSPKFAIQLKDKLANWTKESFDKQELALDRWIATTDDTIEYFVKTLDNVKENQELTLNETESVYNIISALRARLNILINQEKRKVTERILKANDEAKLAVNGIQTLKGGITGWARNEATNSMAIPALIKTYFGENSDISRFAVDDVIDNYSNQAQKEVEFRHAYFDIAKKYNLTNKNGDSITNIKAKVEFMGHTMSQSILMDLYAQTLTDKGRAILLDGGYRYSDKKETFTLHFDENTINSIGEQLTDNQKAFVEEVIAKLYNGTFKEYKAKKDLIYFGFENITDDVYYPTNRNMDSLGLEEEIKAAKILDLRNATINKERTANTSRAIKAFDFFDKLDTYISTISRYGEMTETLDNLSALFDKQARWDGKTFESRVSYINRAIPEFNRFMSYYLDQISGREVSKTISGSNFFSQIVGATLYGNISVVLKQTASLPSILWQVDTKSFIKALKNTPKAIKDYQTLRNELIGLSGVFASRVENLDVVVSETLNKNINALSRFFGIPMEKVDESVIVTVGWLSAQYQAELNGNGAFGTEENKREAVKILNRIILNTQSNSVDFNMSMNRAGATGTLRKVLSYFTSDLQNKFGELYRTAFEAKYAKQRLSAVEGVKTELNNRISEATDELADIQGDIKKINQATKLEEEIRELNQRINNLDDIANECRELMNKSRMVEKIKKDIVSFILSALMVAGVEELVDRLYARKGWTENSLKEFGINAMLEASAFNLPYISTLYNSIKYDSDLGSFDFTPINEILSVGGSIIENIENGWQKEELRKLLFKMAVVGGEFTGLPIKNLYNITMGVLKQTGTWAYNVDNYLRGYSSVYINSQLSDAIKKGNYSGAKGYFDTLVDGYKVEMSKNAKKEVFNLYKNGYQVMPKSIPTDFDGDIKEFKSTYDKASESIEFLLKSSSYNTYTQEEQAKMIKKIYDTYYDSAKGNKSRLSTISKYTNIGKYVLFLQKMSGITETKTQTRKQLTTQYVNRLPLSKSEKLLLLYLSGYKLTADISAYLRKLGMTVDEIKEFLGE